MTPKPFPVNAMGLGHCIQSDPELHVFHPLTALRQGLDKVLAIVVQRDHRGLP